MREGGQDPSWISRDFLFFEQDFLRTKKRADFPYHGRLARVLFELRHGRDARDTGNRPRRFGRVSWLRAQAALDQPEKRSAS
jgi:hypothetical protein